MKKNYLNSGYHSTHKQRKNYKRSVFQIGLMLTLLFCNVISFAQGKINLKQQSSPWITKGYTHEDESKRTRNAKHFEIENNRTAAFISPSSIHYLNEQNQWKDISNALKVNTASNALTHPYMAVENSIKTWFPSNPFNDYILMNTKEGGFKERVSEIRILDVNKNVLSSVILNGNITASVQDNKIIYTGFHPNLSLEYTLGNDGRKFDLLIHSAGLLNSIPAGAHSIVIEEEFLSENASTRMELVNNEVLVYAKGTQVLKFEQPIAFDSNVFAEEQFKGTTSLNLDNERALLKTTYSLSWIKNSARQYPIHLDPTVNYYPQFTTFWTGYQTSSAAKTSGQIRIAGTNNQGWGKFDLATLPPGCTVTGAIYYGYHYSTTSTAKVCEIRGMAAVDPVPSTAGAIFTQITTGNLYNGNYTFGGSTYSWNPGALSGTALSDIASAAGSWIGLGFSYLSGSTTFMYHYGVNGTASNICYLEVTYFTVPCSTVPSANAAVTPTYAICPGAGANIGLSTTYSVGGITYQWHSSAISSVGPFTAVSGATNASITSPTLGTNTWFTAVITCTNVVGSVTATAGQVMVQATTIDTIPYFEGFEGLNTENTLPNCSWASGTLGSTALTYTASNTLGRVPRTGSKFASFYYNPSGTRYFYTNGLQLQAGITYSASLWFTTEYYGYNNWSDLSILVGTTQSPTGLVTIASTNGPAISNVYKSLSDTFSVASSGIYYIAIRGTGSTASSAQYLTWDDLAVTIPCSLNAPNVVLSTSAGTICAGDPVNMTAAGADQYVWNTGATGAVVNETPLISTVFSVTGTHTLSGCSSTMFQPIVVNPAPSVYIYASNPTVCAGTPVNLVAFGNGSSFLWSNSSSGPVISVSPTVQTTYSVIVTNSLNCSGVASQQISIFPATNIQVSSTAPSEMCVGETVTLSATGATSYQWVSGSSPFVQTGSDISVSPVVTTVYTVTGTDANNCSKATTIIQNVNECTGLSEVNAHSAVIAVYPNPAQGEFTIVFNSDSNRLIELTDLSGRVVLSKVSNEGSTRINISHLADGVYYAKINSELSSEVIKLLKQ